jgi:hypothetical protein
VAGSYEHRTLDFLLWSFDFKNTTQNPIHNTEIKIRSQKPTAKNQIQKAKSQKAIRNINSKS